MHRSKIRAMLADYRRDVMPLVAEHPNFNVPEELDTLARFETFINAHENCFSRKNEIGHITGSALVISRDSKRVAVTLHKKLGLWLQFGGHADGVSDPAEVALQEALEESGLKELRIISPSDRSPPLPICWDIHSIPEYRGVPAHDHYDVRFLIQAGDEALTVSDESHDVRWFTVEELKEVTDDRALLRLVEKWQLLDFRDGELTFVSGHFDGSVEQAMNRIAEKSARL